MKLLIISNMSHYQRNGGVVGWGPTAQEIDHLASIFDEVHHIACLHRDEAPGAALPYSSGRVSLVPVPPAGGEGFGEKCGVLRLIPSYTRVILKELRWADVVHVRCPANISLLAILLLAMKRSPSKRWVKYAGNWQPEGGEAWSYAFQRWWLRRGLQRGVVTVNGNWPDQPPHVRSFLNPCLTDEELREGRAAAGAKRLAAPVRLLFVGRLHQAKGVHRALEIMSLLRQRGVDAALDVAGDGPERLALESQAMALGIYDCVTFHGWLARPALDPLYSRGHMMLLPSRSSEGWPKVLSEAMAYGVVPVCGRVSSIPQYLKQCGTGRALHPEDAQGFARAVTDYLANPAVWRTESQNGVRAAESFGYARYLQAVRRLLETQGVGSSDTWGIGDGR